MRRRAPNHAQGHGTEFVWANPPVQVYFDVKDLQGNEVHDASETVRPGKLARGGLPREVIKPGDCLVSIHPKRVHQLVFCETWCCPMENV